MSPEDVLVARYPIQNIANQPLDPNKYAQFMHEAK